MRPLEVIFRLNAVGLSLQERAAAQATLELAGTGSMSTGQGGSGPRLDGRSSETISVPAAALLRPAARWASSRFGLGKRRSAKTKRQAAE